jgi:hypothetical protein
VVVRSALDGRIISIPTENMTLDSTVKEVLDAAVATTAARAAAATARLPQDGSYVFYANGERVKPTGDKIRNLVSRSEVGRLLTHAGYLELEWRNVEAYQTQLEEQLKRTLLAGATVLGLYKERGAIEAVAQTYSTQLVLLWAEVVKLQDPPQGTAGANSGAAPDKNPPLNGIPALHEILSREGAMLDDAKVQHATQVMELYKLVQQRIAEMTKNDATFTDEFKARLDKVRQARAVADSYVELTNRIQGLAGRLKMTPPRAKTWGRPGVEVAGLKEGGTESAAWTDSQAKAAGNLHAQYVKIQSRVSEGKMNEDEAFKT